MKICLLRNLGVLMLCLLALLAGETLVAQNASEAGIIRKLSYEEKLARWNSLSEEQKEAIRNKARSMSEQKFKQLENNFERARQFEPAEQQRVRQNFGRMKQFKPQQRENLRRKFQQFKRLPEERRQQFRRKFIPNFKPRVNAMPAQRPDQWQKGTRRPGQFRPPQRQQTPDNFDQSLPGRGGKPNRPSGFTPGVFPDAQNRQLHDKKPAWGQRKQPDYQPSQGHYRPHQPPLPDRQPDRQHGPVTGYRQPGQKPPDLQGDRDSGLKPVKPDSGGHPHRPPRWQGDNHNRGIWKRPRKHGSWQQQPDAEMLDFRRGMMGDRTRDNQGPDHQKRWQDVEQFREGVDRLASPDIAVFRRRIRILCRIDLNLRTCTKEK